MAATGAHERCDYDATIFVEVDHGEGPNERYQVEVACHDGRWSMTTHTIMDNGASHWVEHDIEDEGTLVAHLRDQPLAPDPLTALRALVGGQLV